MSYESGEKLNEKQISAVGERIRSARMQLGYSRRAFADKFGISGATLQAWEDGKYDIPLKGIARYVDALYKAGLATTQEWFINGIGLPPRPVGTHLQDINNTDNFINSDILSEDEIILREVAFFEAINNNPAIIVVSDDTMLPVFEIGDYVGGNKVSGKYAAQYIGTFCIVTLNTGETFVKKIKFGSINGLFNLIGINLDSDLETTFLPDCQIYELAQIVWHRKVERITER